MASSSKTIISLLASAALASAAALGGGLNSDLVQPRADDCNAVHLFLARGNNEPYPGRQRAMVEGICDGVSNCGYEDLIYSALYTDLSCQTLYDGVHAAYQQVSAYACKCPDAKLVLLGYSQGANIMTDFLGGGGGTGFNDCIQPDTPALNRKTFPGNRISAVAVFGDTRHTANQPYNVGGGSGLNGVFPRSESQLAALTTWTDILYSYCGPNDPICAAGQDKSNYIVQQHLGYYDSPVAGEAAAWVKKVANIKDDSNFATMLPTSISGTAQNYATIASGFVPPGTVQPYPVSTVQCSVTSSSTPTPTPTTSTKTSVSTPKSTSSPATSTTLTTPTPTPTTPSSTSTPSTTSTPTTTPAPSTTAAPLTSAVDDSSKASSSSPAAAQSTTATTTHANGATSFDSVGLLGSILLAAAAFL